jgi:hypothetical protein
MERFWRVATLRREPAAVRGYVLGLIALALLGTPFAWSSDTLPTVVWGLPAWVWVALVCSAAVSCLTAWAALARWDDADDTSQEPP